MRNTSRIHLKETGKIAAMSLIQVSEVDNSNQMEKKGFIKTLQMFKDENITPRLRLIIILKYTSI